MKVTHYLPSHPLLKNVIEKIYLLERSDNEPAEKYLAFPGIHHFVTINKAAVCSVTKQVVSVRHETGHSPSGLLISNFGKPHLWHYEGKIEEWNIIFKPLGINYFIEVNSGLLCQENVFSEFNYFNDFTTHINSLYTIDNNTDKVNFIESYWLSKLRLFNHPFLHSLMEEILTKRSEKINFSQLASHFNVSRDTLHFAFKRYVGTTPGRFEKVFRFRNALAAYRNAEHNKKLTHVSVEADYFDQSHMIRDFKSFTGFTPKDFFKSIAAFPEGNINWIFSEYI